MKVIFIKDNKKDKKGEVKDVSDGFAKNFLIPKGFCIQATQENMAKYNKEQSDMKKALEEKKEEIEKIISKFSQEVIEIVKPVAPNGMMQGSISKNEIADKIKEQMGIEIDKKNLKMSKINTYGIHGVKLSLGEGMSALLTIQITMH